MNIKVVAFGIARDILKSSQLELKVPENSTIGSLKQMVMEKYPDFRQLRSLRFAINEDYQDEDYCLSDNDEVVIIPPVSGG